MPTQTMSKYLNDFFIDEEKITKINNVERKKFLQKLKIIKHLFLNGETSNAEVCQRFNVSLPTSMSLLNQLLEEGILVKKGRGKSEGGRKPDLYGLVENSFFVVSIHIERFSIKLALLDNNHTIITQNSWSKDISTENNIVDQLYEWTQILLEETSIKFSQVMGVGISMPGLVSAKAGKNFSYYLSEQEPESLQEKFENKFKTPVALLNDAKSSCLAEFRFGGARNKNNVLVISMDWGIGLGIIMGGKMHSGETGFSGEFGHIPMNEDGLLCHCGKRGCLETEASGLALVRKTKEGLEAGQTSVLNNLNKEELQKLAPETIIEAANKGDQFAINTLSEIGINLGKGIAILVQIFNPELIILEGKISQAKQFITTPIQQSMNTYCMMQLKERTTLQLSKLGDSSSIYGGTIAVMDNIFKDQVNLVKSYIS